MNVHSTIVDGDVPEMPTGLNRREENKLRYILAYLNIRRVLYVSLACIFVIPVLLVINKYFASEEVVVTMRGALIAFEVFSVLSAGFSYMLFQSDNVSACRVATYAFWVVFEIFSCLIVYSNIMSGARTTFYAIMLAALLLTPLMSMGELMYYMVIQGVYAIFVMVDFGVNMNDVVNVAILNVAFLTASRVMYKIQIDRLTLRDKQREESENSQLDRLTGFMNRDGLLTKLYTVVGECIRNRRRMSLIVVDIDELGEYNQAFGKGKGDECIRLVAGEIRKMSMHSTGDIARLGAGRFVLVLTGGDDITPVRLAEKIRQSVYGKRIMQSRQASTECVSVSIGVASSVLRSNREFNELFDEAEEALMNAKDHGRNITIYDEQIYGGEQSTRRSGRAAY